MALAHGSGQACYLSRTGSTCEECRTYQRERLRRNGQTPGTYRYNAMHGLERAGEVQNDIRRRGMRRTRDAVDKARLEELWQS